MSELSVFSRLEHYTLLSIDHRSHSVLTPSPIIYIPWPSTEYSAMEMELTIPHSFTPAPAFIDRFLILISGELEAGGDNRNSIPLPCGSAILVSRTSPLKLQLIQ